MWASLIIGAVMMIPEFEPLPDEMKGFESEMWGLMAFSFGVPVVLILFVSRGKNWARILMLLLTMFGIACYLAFAPAPGSEPVWAVAANVLVTVLDVVALYWLFSKPGSEWFAHGERTSAV